MLEEEAGAMSSFASAVDTAAEQRAWSSHFPRAERHATDALSGR